MFKTFVQKWVPKVRLVRVAPKAQWEIQPNPSKVIQEWLVLTVRLELPGPLGRLVRRALKGRRANLALVVQKESQASLASPTTSTDSNNAE